MTSKQIVGLLLAGFLALPALMPGSPQNAVTLQRIDVTGIPNVVLYFTVTDQKENSVLGLTEDEITVSVDQVPQRITSLNSALIGGEFLAVALLFDRSGSMKNALPGTRKAAIQFLKRLSRDDQLAVVSFDDHIRVDADFSSDRTVIEAAIDRITAGVDTALYDAVHTALGLLGKVGTKRQAVLILSDGKDNKSKLRLDEVTAEAKKFGVPLYTLGLGEGFDPIVLSRLATDTGGKFVKAADPAELILLYQRLAELLKNQYTLSFTSSTGNDSQWHNLRISVTDPAGQKAEVRREFISTSGPGLSREILGGFEREVETQGLLTYGGVGAFFGLCVGLLLIFLIKVFRREARLFSPLAVGVVLLSLVLGGIVGLILKSIGG